MKTDAALIVGDCWRKHGWGDRERPHYPSDWEMILVQAGLDARLSDENKSFRSLLEGLIDAAEDWCQETAEDCDHQPAWQSLSGAYQNARAILKDGEAHASPVFTAPNNGGTTNGETR